MITKIHGKFYLVCDFCQKEIGPCDTWEEAKDQKKDEGFKSQKDGNDWLDVCRECRKQN